MRIHHFARALAISIPFLFIACSKKEEAAAPVVQTPASHPVTVAPETTKAVNAAVAEAKPAAVATANEAAKTADGLKATASDAAGAASTQVQSWFDKIKGLINEKKYSEALTALAQPPTNNLTAEQQKVVDQLKAQVQELLAKQSADQGLKAVGGLLNKKN